jgi:Na+-transporting NADH:ubiquinone oxidoreductase subunit C
MYSNRYVFVFASIMVVVVALLLSTASSLLQPLQEKNIRIEKMQNILSSVGVEASKAEIEEKFNEFIVGQKVVNSKGEILDGIAFEVDLRDENRKPEAERQLAVFEALVNGANYVIVPLRGQGLWGAVWGYLSFEEDLTTIAGANFDHASETPGLGAEISTREFEKQFAGKRIFDDNGVFTPVRAIKGGALPTDPHGVDAVSGGTITSDGLSKMISQGLQLYESYFKKLIE